MRKLLLIILIAIYTIGYSQNNISQLDFLIGTWKTENKEYYEIWEKDTINNFNGHSYYIENGKKNIIEILSIKKIDSKVIYEAKVINQNNGESILFTLNTKITSCFSFENSKHDFPKKIQYQKITDDKIKIKIIGDKNKGFSYFQIKQKL
tara:strand:+ start:21 stop:470 length:450 start_codon:yes stop_codon:yes gene_type:complete